MHIKKSNNRAIAMVLTIAMLLSMLGQVAMAAPIAPDVISQSYVCGMTEHTHGPECYEDQGYEYQCFKELRKTEGQGKPKTWNIIHEHNEFCYLDGALICPLKERTAHIHGESCYEIPQLPAVDDSADVSTDIDEAGDGTDADIDTQMMVAEPVLTCTLQDTSELTVHNHTEEKCLPAEHKVGLICAVPEHTHSSSCLPKVEEPKETATPEPTPIPTPTPTPVVESKEPVPSHTVTPTHTIPPTATPTETPLPTFEPTPSLDVDITEPPAIGSDEPVVGSDEPVMESEEPSDNPAEESPSDEPAEEEPGEDEDLIAPQFVSVTYAAQVQNTVVANSGSTASFTFAVKSIENYDDVIMPTTKNVRISGNGLGALPEITFSKPGTYQFTIYENTTNSNYRCDKRTYTLTVTVIENEGKLTAVGEYKLDAEGSEPRTDYAAFINTYTVVPSWSSKTINQAQAIMNNMTLEEKVGQLFLIHYPGDGAGTVSQATTLINKYHPGGYLVFAAMFKNGTTESVQRKIADTQAASKIPLLFTVDEEGGISGSGTRVVRVSQYPQYGHDPFKSPQELKAAGGLSAVASDAVDKAAFLKNLGLNVNHAPVADISGPSGYMYGRTWGGDGIENAQYVETLVRASESAGMATTLKHFPGYGGTSSNTHNGFAVNDLAWEDFLYNDLLPFQAGMAAGSHAVMVTHNTINCLDKNNPSSLSPAVYNMLRNTMHFDGVAMTDDLAMGAIINYVGAGQASLRALQAGADMAMTSTPDTDIPVVLTAVENGSLSLNDIETKCRRILCWKIEMGLIDEKDIPVDTSSHEAKYTYRTTTEYGTFEDMWALADRRGAGKVQLLKNVLFNDSKKVGAGDDITLDLNGCTLSYIGSNEAFDISGTFAIDDSSNAFSKSTHSSTSTIPTGFFSETKTLNYMSSEKGAIISVNFGATGSLKSNSASSLISVKGGKFYLKNAYLENTNSSAITSSNSSYNYVYIQGGAIVNCKESAIRMTGGYFNMTGGYITGNTSKTNGGGVSLSNVSEGRISAGSIIAHNSSEFDGGGIYAYGSDLRVYGTISGNNAQNNGGGISVNDTTLSCSGTIINNSATQNGGGIYQSRDTCSLGSGAISRNHALRGGGIAVLGGSISTGVSTLISQNQATDGGGIYLGDSNASITGSATIENNVATNGGGIYAYGKATNIVIAGTITGNTASGVGGGIAAGYETTAVNKVSLTGQANVSNNNASYMASGLYANASKLAISESPKIKGNGSEGKDNLYLCYGQLITVEGTDNASKDTLHEAEIHVFTESTAGAIHVAYADGTTLPNFVINVFKPDRNGYVTTLNNGRVAFTSSEEASIPVYVILDGKPYQVDTINSVYCAESNDGSMSKFIYLKDFSSALKDYRFDAANYRGESAFGFQISDGPITVSANQITSHLDGWHITVPATNNLNELKLYYLPNSAISGSYTMADVAATNGLWSVTVNDAYWSIDENAKDMSSLQYVPAGQGIVFELPARNDFWDWKVNNHTESDFQIDLAKSDNSVKVTITDIHAPVVISSTNEGDVKYTAQYFAMIESTALSSSATGSVLEVIDTSGRKLPKNGTSTLNIKYMQLNSDGSVKTSNTMKRIYNDRNYIYSAAPTLVQADRLYTYNHYDLVELWVLKSGCNPESNDANDWDIYSKTELGIDSIHDLKLTNSPEYAIPNDTICISEGTVVRFVYNQKNNLIEAPVSFFDYDITDGKIYTTSQYSTSKPTSAQSGMSEGYANTDRQGINSSSNYSKWGAHLAFGNGNTGSGWAEDSLSDGFINRFNRDSNKVVLGYKGCYFGIVTGINDDGTLRYKDGIVAPKLFNVGDAVGKTPITGHSLQFSQKGDTYTLEAVTDTNANKLSTFRHPHPKYPGIWSNDFWPMDSAPTYGADGHDLKFGTGTKWRFNSGGLLPTSDDFLDHNAYFGMHFSVDFSLPEGYIGDLNYTFFGDDDMWAFLDGELILDIGGVHSSVGEYVNLWDYMEEGDTSQHRLEFFYTERGASGSTCWIQFTIPMAKFLKEDWSANDGSLRIEKSVVNNPYSETQPFDFTITVTDSSGNTPREDYSYVMYDRNGKRLGYGLISHGKGSFSLVDGQYVIVPHLPHGTHYTVEEARYSCTTSVTVNEQTETTRIYGGEIVRGRTDELLYINDYTNKPMMPETGGPGTLNFWWFYYGAIIMATTFAVVYLKRREEY